MPTAHDIARDNDAFRITGTGRGQTLFTAGASTPVERQLLLQAAVQTFTTFTEDNDPYGEHDFGKLELLGVTYFWKIDYYASAECRLGGDPYSEPVYRVLTVMRADEY